jgi:thiol-disulfide isomerase/thioredoxin
VTSRYFPWTLAGAVAVPALSCWLAYGRLLPADLPLSPATGVSASRGHDAASPADHYVTPRQLIASGETGQQNVTELALVTNEDRRLGWQELSDGRPVVVVFVKQGCPCSRRFEPYFHQLAAAYGQHVQFIDVIDGSVEVAQRYAAANQVPYPVVADEDHAMIRRFEARGGAYVALVDPTGVVATLSPGCSVEMMDDLSRRIAVLTGQDLAVCDFEGLPGGLTSGCPFTE